METVAEHYPIAIRNDMVSLSGKNFASQLLYTNYMSPPGWLAKDHPGGLFHIHYRGISSRNTSRLISLRQKVALISIPSAKNPARSADELSIIPTFSHIHIRIRGDFPLRLFRRIPLYILWKNGASYSRKTTR